ncbi:hypothetical protein VTK73DRAFT_3385 [Phialemonium thermophilum]|uniref:Uncharacterized protein n=1 Tax=Phialemonium thermophilum TaxID=223376 RepID=A0ABR3X036_9PEZI
MIFADARTACALEGSNTENPIPERVQDHMDILCVGMHDGRSWQPELSRIGRPTNENFSSSYSCTASILPGASM